ncbi:MAG: hypothetical protein WB239_04585 [Acidimicrobiia bacterium]
MIFAYLDPGSGSLILQAVLGGAAGLGVAAKAMRSRWRRRKEGDEGESEETTDQETAPVETGET